MIFALQILGLHNSMINHLTFLTYSHSYEQATSYGRPLGHSPKWHFVYKCTSYELPLALKGHFSCVTRVAAHSRFYCTAYRIFRCIIRYSLLFGRSDEGYKKNAGYTLLKSKIARGYFLMVKFLLPYIASRNALFFLYLTDRIRHSATWK